jgi:hypothetical protein
VYNESLLRDTSTIMIIYYYTSTHPIFPMEKRYKMKTKRRKRFTTSLVVRRMHLDSGTGLGDFIGRHNVVGGALCDKNIAQRTLVNLGGQQKNLVARSLST